MFATDAAASFADFGPSAYYSRRRPLASWDLPREGKARRRLIRTCAPGAPGVYGMIDGDGELIYVGKSRNLASRLMSYFPARGSGEKSERIGRHARRLVWETSPHEFLALLRELELIRRFEPRFNVEGKPERQRPAYLCLTSGPAPYFRVAEQPPSGCTTWFGPLQRFGRLRDAVEQLNRRFLLRDCPARTPMIFAEQRELFEAERRPACLRVEFGTCLGPCAALCTIKDYAQCVERALKFLRGDDAAILHQLEAEMRIAARDQVYERAIVLRDAWQSIQWIHRGLERLRSLRDDFSFVYEVHCRQRRKAWVLIRSGHAILARSRPAGPQAAGAMQRLLHAVYADDAAAPSEQGDLDMLRLVGAWFHHREEEIKRTRPPEEALRHCEELRRGAASPEERGMATVQPGAAS